MCASPAGTTIVFRGVASSGLQFGAVSSSALYLDEQPITQSGRNPDPRLIDIERLEALRGPQGTLYGASSQSGTLRIITNKPDPSEFDGWVDVQGTSIDEGGEGYDASVMFNVPLVADRLALRFVGFTAEDAGFIDNVLSDSPRGQTVPRGRNLRPTPTGSPRTSMRRRPRARARRCAGTSTDDVDVTLTGLIQDLEAGGHGDVNLGVGDLNQVRFEDESLDDKWYQLALTLNASLAFGDLVLSASYFDRDFRYEADATDYEFTFTQTTLRHVYDCIPTTCQRRLRFRRRSAGLRDQRRADRDHDVRGPAAVAEAIRRAAGRWLVGAFYSEEKGHTEFDSFIRGYEDTASFYYLSGLSVLLHRQLSRTDGTLVPRPLRH